MLNTSILHIFWLFLIAFLHSESLINKSVDCRVYYQTFATKHLSYNNTRQRKQIACKCKHDRANATKKPLKRNWFVIEPRFSSPIIYGNGQFWLFYFYDPVFVIKVFGRWLARRFFQDSEKTYRQKVENGFVLHNKTLFFMSLLWTCDNYLTNKHLKKE